jgi:hypothetical protein
VATLLTNNSTTSSLKTAATLRGKGGGGFGNLFVLNNKRNIKTPKASKKRRAAHGGTPKGGSSTAYKFGDAMHMNRRITTDSDVYEDAIHGDPDETIYSIEYSINRRTWTTVERNLNDIERNNNPSMVVLRDLIPCQHYFIRVRQKNDTGWSMYNEQVLQVCTRDYQVGDHVLWYNQGPWIKTPSWTGGIVKYVPDVAKQGHYGVEPMNQTTHQKKHGTVSSVAVDHLKETTKDGREEAKHRWKMVSSLVAGSKSFTMPQKHKEMFKTKKSNNKTTKQLLNDRHDEVHRFLMLDDVNMTPGNIVNTTNIDSRKESSAVSFKGTVKVLLFASKLKNKMLNKKNKEPKGGGTPQRRKSLAPIEIEMRKRLRRQRYGQRD